MKVKGQDGGKRAEQDAKRRAAQAKARERRSSEKKAALAATAAVSSDEIAPEASRQQERRRKTTWLSSNAYDAPAPAESPKGIERGSLREDGDDTASKRRQTQSRDAKNPAMYDGAVAGSASGNRSGDASAPAAASAKRDDFELIGGGNAGDGTRSPSATRLSRRITVDDFELVGGTAVAQEGRAGAERTVAPPKANAPVEPYGDMGDAYRSRSASAPLGSADAPDEDDEYEYVELSEIKGGALGYIAYLLAEYRVFFIALAIIFVCIIVVMLTRNLSTAMFFFAFALLAFLMAVLLRGAWRDRKKAKDEWLKAESLYRASREKAMEQEGDEADEEAAGEDDARD